MIELIQFSWSPYCIVTRRVLEFSGKPFKVRNIPNGERTLVWKLTKGAYYAVPVIRDGSQVIYEMGEETQVIAKYIDAKHSLGLFPAEMEGVQSLLWRYIENEVEGLGFKLNDVHWKEFVLNLDKLVGYKEYLTQGLERIFHAETLHTPIDIFVTSSFWYSSPRWRARNRVTDCI